MKRRRSGRLAFCFFSALCWSQHSCLTRPQRIIMAKSRVHSSLHTRAETMYAFEKAVEIGVDVLETDAHITRDGHIVLMHDEEVDRTTDGSGLIEDLVLAELKQLDAAYKWSKDEDKTFPYQGQGARCRHWMNSFRNFHGCGM